MSPAAEKIIKDLKDHMTSAFNELVALVQEEAVNEMISKLSPATAKVRLIREEIKQVPIPVSLPVPDADEDEDDALGYDPVTGLGGDVRTERYVDPNDNNGSDGDEGEYNQIHV